MIDLKNKKDDSITVLEFQKVKNYPAFARIAIFLGILIGISIYLITKKIWPIFLFSILGAAIYSYLSYNYRCPDCRSFLWFLKDKHKLRRCPKCQAKLRDEKSRRR